MTEDRELLEAAAETAGIEIEWDGDQPIPFGADCAWNPLTDDGDALRLAVKLKLDILPGETSVLVSRSLNHPRRIQEEEDYGDDPAAATRRAIVRAAAAMAKEC